MKLAFILLLTILTANACHNPDIAKGVPRCIYREISAGRKDSNWMTGTVKEYVFQNRTVYAFEPDITKIADGATTIKDGECNTLCNIGGFGGMAINQCNGDNFFKAAVYKRTIWEKK